MEDRLPFRIDIKKEWLNSPALYEEVIGEFRKRKSLMVFEGDGVNIKHHAHGLINMTKSGARSFFNRILKIQGTQYSLSSKDVRQYGIDGYLNYICKGTDKNNPPVKYIGISDDDVKRYHSQYYQNQKDFREKLKKDKMTIGQQLDVYMLEGCKYTEELSLCECKKQVLRLILQFYFDKDKELSNSRLENLFLRYMTKLRGHQFIQIRIDKFLERFSRF